MTDWKIERAAALHYQRQFLAGEDNRWDAGSCYSYVLLNRISDPDGAPAGVDIEAEINISDGFDTAHFDASTCNEADEQDAYLAMMCKLRDQLIAYCAAYGEAVAKTREQSVTVG